MLLILQLAAESKRARRLLRLYNQTTEAELEKRTQLLQDLFGTLGPQVEIVPPFHCDYGSHIYAGEWIVHELWMRHSRLQYGSSG